jgi:hypothetical protein
LEERKKKLSGLEREKDSLNIHLSGMEDGIKKRVE